VKILEFRGGLAAKLRLVFTVAVAACGGGLPARAQVLPSEPLTFADGRVRIGGDVTATFSCAHAGSADGGPCGDDVGFFNYTDYDHSLLRMLRVDVAAEIRASDRVSVLGEIRTENGLPFDTRSLNGFRPYGLYVRVRPWPRRAFDVQVGRVPPTFGSFARRSYASENFLIGYPLAYQYLTSLRPDSLPANADELLRMRGRGWLSSFSVGQTAPAAGLPIASAIQWDTGIQLHGAVKTMDLAAAVTSGTLGNPLVGDDNNGRQVAGRVAFRPVAGLQMAVSAARGPFVSRHAALSAGTGGATGRFTQAAWGTDVEYSRDHYVLRFEAIRSDWRLPLVKGPAIDLPLRALATSLEARYKLQPGLYVAGRWDRVGFSEITGTTRRASWDAPVTRIEVGTGYALQRNVILKLSVQRNTRDGGRTQRLDITALQAVYWF
jgi:hypothetical protein